MMKTKAARKRREESRAKIKRVRVADLIVALEGFEASGTLVGTGEATSEDEEDVRSRRLRGGRTDWKEGRAMIRH